jgi:hypothetical protein
MWQKFFLNALEQFEKCIINTKYGKGDSMYADCPLKPLRANKTPISGYYQIDEIIFFLKKTL